MARRPNPDRGKVEIVADPDEIRRWIACAEDDGRSLSAWIRKACAEAARRARKDRKSYPTPLHQSPESVD